jgi:hypothetical protein
MMKQARASQSQIDAFRQFLIELDEILDDPSKEIEDIGDFVKLNYRSRCGLIWQKIIYGYETMFENACDPTAETLEWKPEIKAVLKREKLV